MSGTGPTLTVIVAVFNGAATLRRCLDSIMRQTYAAKHLIVLDGGSTDGTVEILRQYDDRIAHWESKQDRGIYHAWNKGLEHSTGDWICFVGADDYFWADDVLERMAVHLPIQPTEARVVYGKDAVTSKTGEVLRYEGRPWEQARRDLAWSLTLPHPGLFHHQSLFAEHGGFDESFQIAGDYELLLRELKTRPALFVPHVVVVGFQHGGVSHSPKAMSALLKEVSRARRKHHVRPTLPIPSVQWKMLLAALAFRTVGDAGFRRLADGYRRLRGQPAIWREDGAMGHKAS
jgi:hypothetical protein